tara:strand:- start:2913 stop:3623 length:711 start_codon:yes stop_codon:yes gene_type:complete
MKVLELFSGTHSVGKVAREKGWEVLSLDIDGDADINIDILKWDYKKDYKEGDFDIIFASPPCHTFSNCRRCWIGRKIKEFGDEIVTAELLDDDMIKNGLPLLRKTQEIIKYFKPKFWFIENPQTSKMKNFLPDLAYYDIDYCKYSDWGYRKRTRIWTNVENFDPKLCNKDCENMFDPTKHKKDVGNYYKNKNGNIKKMHKNNLGGATNKLTNGKSGDKNLKYRIPPKLINELFSGI